MTVSGAGSGDAMGYAAAREIGRLTAAEQRAVAELAEVDRRVRSHEQAHLAAAGGYARGAPSYSYVRGPDGKLYAVGGEVSIDTSPVPGDPQATIRKARAVQAAANAPVDPSPQDRQVAAQAAQMEAAAQSELRAARAHETAGVAGYREEQPVGSLLDVVG